MHITIEQILRDIAALSAEDGPGRLQRIHRIAVDTLKELAESKNSINAKPIVNEENTYEQPN